MAAKLTPQQKRDRRHARATGAAVADLVALAVAGQRSADRLCVAGDLRRAGRFLAGADIAENSAVMYAVSAAHLARRSFLS